jgi:hypothetical protein
MGGKFIIPKDSTKPIRAIYTPEVQKIAEGIGEVTMTRASHVEPGNELSEEARKWLNLELEDVVDNKWYADMLPVDGPVLGPYDDRDTALAEEVKWLNDNNIPVCGDCRTQIEPPDTPVLTQADLDEMDDMP